MDTDEFCIFNKFAGWNWTSLTDSDSYAVINGGGGGVGGGGGWPMTWIDTWCHKTHAYSVSQHLLMEERGGGPAEITPRAYGNILSALCGQKILVQFQEGQSPTILDPQNYPMVP